MTSLNFPRPILTRPILTRRGLLLSAGSFGALALAGCGGPAPRTFDLSALPGGPSRAGGGRGQLVISAPVATAALDSDRIVVRSGPEEIAYLPGAQWSDRLPQLVQARLVQSLENAHLLAAVSRTGQGVVGDWSMSGEVRRFEIDVPAGQAVVEITVKLANSGAGRIVGAMVARGAAPGGPGRPEDATAALDAALAQALAQIVAFVRGRV